MNTAIMLGVDLAAIVLLTFAVYYPRHRRRDLLVAFLGVNVGVFAVAAVLSSSTVGMGLGLGLFGVLSIIRLRSYEISQREIVYYFAALAIGLVTGLPTTDFWLPIGLVVLVLVVMWAGDHPRLFSRSHQQIVTIDGAIPDREQLRARLGTLLGGTVTAFTVQRLDFVDDVTVVDVRYRADAAPARAKLQPAAAATAIEAPEQLR
jgi:hypothetical protein